VQLALGALPFFDFLGGKFSLSGGRKLWRCKGLFDFHCTSQGEMQGSGWMFGGALLLAPPTNCDQFYRRGRRDRRVGDRGRGEQKETKETKRHGGS